MYSSYACLRHVESKQGDWPCRFMPCEQRLLGKSICALRRCLKRFHELLKNILFQKYKTVSL